MGMSREAVRNDRNRRRPASAASSPAQCGASSSSEDCGPGPLQPAHAELVAAAERAQRDTLGALEPLVVRYTHALTCLQAHLQ